jgi:hypothetical protein
MNKKRLPRLAAAITSHPPVTHRTSEVIAAEIAAVDAFEGTKKDAFAALWKRWGHPNAAAMKSFYYDERAKALKPRAANARRKK